MITNLSKNNINRKLRKRELVNKGEVSCGYCRYNKGENANHKGKPDRYKKINRDSIRWKETDFEPIIDRSERD